MNEMTFTKPRSDCDTSRYHAPDVMASEEEVSRFLGALVDLLHPDHVLETGSYLGYTSEAIGRALANQGYGHLDSLEVNCGLSEQARLMCLGLPVTVHHANSLTFVPQHLYDLVFLDSDKADRVIELERFQAYASSRAVVAVHDSRHPSLRDAIRTHLQAIQFPTPRGLALGVFK